MWHCDLQNCRRQERDVEGCAVLWAVWCPQLRALGSDAWALPSPREAQMSWEGAAGPLASGGLRGACRRCRLWPVAWQQQPHQYLGSSRETIRKSAFEGRFRSLRVLCVWAENYAKWVKWKIKLAVFPHAWGPWPATNLRMTSLIPKQVHFVPHGFPSPVQLFWLQKYLKVLSLGEKGGGKGSWNWRGMVQVHLGWRTNILGWCGEPTQYGTNSLWG